MDESLITLDEIKKRLNMKNSSVAIVVIVLIIVDLFVAGLFGFLLYQEYITKKLLFNCLVYMIIYNAIFIVTIYFIRRSNKVVAKEIQKKKFVINVGKVKSKRMGGMVSANNLPYIESDSSYYATIEGDEEIRISQEDYHVLEKEDFIYIVRTSKANLGGWACRAHDLAPELESLVVLPAGFKRN